MESTLPRYRLSPAARAEILHHYRRRLIRAGGSPRVQVSERSPVFELLGEIALGSVAAIKTHIDAAFSAGGRPKLAAVYEGWAKSEAREWRGGAA